MTERSSEHATFVIERTYGAAPQRVFAAWASKEAKSAWFGPRESPGIEDALSAHQLDFRTGGEERFAVKTESGDTYTYIARFQDIVNDERIVYTYEMYLNDDRISVSVSTVELLAAEGATALTYTEQGVFLDGHDTAAQREHGTRELLLALGESLGAEVTDR
jgi:uncharacterized protein YndB with AHSA1/START domain